MAIKTASGSGLSNSLSSGLVLLNTTSFSAVASQDINDVFSSTYDHYKIFFLAKMASSEGSVSIRMKTGSVDSGSVYAYAIVSLGANNTSYNQTSTSATSGYFGRVGNGMDGGYEMTIFNPNKATQTSYVANGVGNGPTATFTERAGGGVFTTTQYTGIQFLSVGGINITGSVSIYGVNK
jgi:hypothetical protein